MTAIPREATPGLKSRWASPAHRAYGNGAVYLLRNAPATSSSRISNTATGT